LRIARNLLLAVLALLLLPYLLAPLYRRPSGLDADGLALG
jgi:hypothetical protein